MGGVGGMVMEFMGGGFSLCFLPGVGNGGHAIGSALGSLFPFTVQTWLSGTPLPHAFSVIFPLSSNPVRDVRTDP